jgi:hypothetical protein
MTTRVARRATRTRVQMQHRRHRAASKLKKRDFSFLFFSFLAPREAKYFRARAHSSYTDTVLSFLLIIHRFVHTLPMGVLCN